MVKWYILDFVPEDTFENALAFSLVLAETTEGKSSVGILLGVLCASFGVKPLLWKVPS